MSQSAGFLVPWFSPAIAGFTKDQALKFLRDQREFHAAGIRD
jgi:cyanate permease